MIERWRLLLSGAVQGVGLRYAIARQARQLGLLGWVKNQDSQVVIEVEGDASNLEKLINWLKIGQSFAQINKLDKIVVALEGGRGFNIRFSRWKLFF